MLDQLARGIPGKSNIVIFFKHYKTEILKTRRSIKTFLIPEKEEKKFNENRLTFSPQSSILGGKICFSANRFANW